MMHQTTMNGRLYGFDWTMRTAGIMKILSY